MHSCHSIPEYCNLFSLVKLSIRSFCFISSFRTRYSSWFISKYTATCRSSTKFLSNVLHHDFTTCIVSSNGHVTYSRYVLQIYIICRHGFLVTVHVYQKATGRKCNFTKMILSNLWMALAGFGILKLELPK